VTALGLPQPQLSGTVVILEKKEKLRWLATRWSIAETVTARRSANLLWSEEKILTALMLGKIVSTVGVC